MSVVQPKHLIDIFNLCLFDPYSAEVASAVLARLLLCLITEPEHTVQSLPVEMPGKKLMSGLCAFKYLHKV